jgi:hypothetical protein
MEPELKALNTPHQLSTYKRRPLINGPDQLHPFMVILGQREDIAGVEFGAFHS